MARFVLVHGAFAGGWIWEPLASRLRAAGHIVEAPDLPGSGEDFTPASAVTLDTCAARICDALLNSAQASMLVGNSMGGLIATQAAARCPDRVAGLVYVAAFAPRDGQSLLDLTRLPEGAGDQVQANIVIEGDPPVAKCQLPHRTMRYTDRALMKWSRGRSHDSAPKPSRRLQHQSQLLPAASPTYPVTSWCAFGIGQFRPCFSAG